MTLTKKDFLIAAALSLATFLVFAQTRRFDFIPVDDPQYVKSNDRVLSGLSLDNIGWAFTTGRMANWHPLTWMSHMLDAQLFGPGPGGPHLVNAVMHSVNAGLAFVVLMLMTGRRGRSAIVAALFALHPLRMESVAWIAERKDVLCGFFFLAGVGAYVLYVQRRSWKWYGAAFVAMALGLMAKPAIVTLPCVLLLLDYWPLKRPARFGRLVVEKVPFFGIAIASSIITMIVQRAGGAMSAMDLPLSMRLANAVLAYARYLGKTVFPEGLAAFYPYPGVVRGTTFPWSHAAIATVVIIVITVIAILMWKRERAVLVGWLWFLGVLVPSIGIVQVGLQSMADRYTYLPHIGLFIAIVWGIGAIVERSAGLRQASAVFAGGVTLVLAGCTAYQLRYWENGHTLFTHALEVTESNSAAHMALAIWLTAEGRGEEALPHYRETLRLQPNIADAQNNIGNFYRERGDLAAALKHLQMAVEINPRYPEGHHNLANVLGDLGRIDEAERAYRRAIELEPDAAQFHYNLGLLLAGAGRFETAAVEFEAALKIRPRDVDARFMLALALLEAGQRDAAKVQLEQVLSARPDWTDAMGRFAWVLATSDKEASRDPKAAMQLANHANQLSGFGNPRLLDTLAAAYAASGVFDQAVQAATRARDLALAREQKEFAQRVDERLRLYQAGKAFHVPPTTSPRGTGL